MKAQILDGQDFLWLQTLEKLTHDVYHLPEYLSIEAKRTKTIPQAFLASDGEKIFFLPYLLRKCDDLFASNLSSAEVFDVVSPYGYPGILLSEAASCDRDFAASALEMLKTTFKIQGICSAFFRLHPLLSNDFPEIFGDNTFIDTGKTVSVDLTLSQAQIWAHTRKGHQSTINKCKRLGLTARMVSYAEYMSEFIDLYEETMDRVVAKQSYYFNRAYFEDLLKLGDRLHLCIVEAQNQIAAASLFFESCGIVQAHLGGTRTEFLKQSPFNLLLHHARLWAKERGNQFLHLGGGVGGAEDRLFTFKSGFSRQTHSYLTSRLILNKENYALLVESRAKSLNVRTEDLLGSDLFPAYRISETSFENKTSDL
jgi:hypothetical protein